MNIPNKSRMARRFIVAFRRLMLLNWKLTRLIKKAHSDDTRLPSGVSGIAPCSNGGWPVLCAFCKGRESLTGARQCYVLRQALKDATRPADTRLHLETLVRALLDFGMGSMSVMGFSPTIQNE